ncbi:MAG: hypothetical protein IKS45_09305 [Thermoguttaceae bacterium]|nr:hypothetical protein [Thermoguttaceae bacterium]MBR6436690.1 hypothetical protein [Thermoguttaceae bacterium]
MEQKTLTSDNIILEELLSDGCIGFLEKVAVYKQFLEKVDAQFNEQLSIVNEKRKEYTTNKDEKIKELKNKYRSNYAVFFLAPFILSCILFTIFPRIILLLLFPAIIVAYKIMEIRTIGPKITEVEFDYKKKIDVLDKQESQLKEKYTKLLKEKELKISFSETQMEFLTKIATLFKNTPQLGEVVCMKPVLTQDSVISDEYSKSGIVSFENVNPGEYLKCRIPTMTVENRTLYFFPQGLLIEENGSFAELRYNKITISQYQNCLTAVKHPLKGSTIVQEIWEHARVDGTQDKRYKENDLQYALRYFGAQIVNASFLVKPFYFSNEQSAIDFIQGLIGIIRNAPVK